MNIIYKNKLLMIKTFRSHLKMIINNNIVKKLFGKQNYLGFK